MNFEVFCFGFVDDSLQVVQKEYFETIEEARAFEREQQHNYNGISITPMNWEAGKQMEKQK